MLVIAISGCSGSGKTSLIRALVKKLPGASPLFADTYASDYCPSTVDFPLYRYLPLSDAERCQKWFDEGFPEDGYASCPQLVQDIRELKEGRPISTPIPAWEGGEHRIEPGGYLLLEDAWAHRSELRGLVDYFIHIGVPLDIALARCIQRQVRQKDDIGRLVNFYLTVAFKNSRAVNQPRAHHHLTLDGLRPTEALASEVVDWLRAAGQTTG
ncbi:MAG: hypothetical protein K0R17_3162 [Rariglobus sp.]|jgi:uridine kinase|nr:hypothetical protein [Rariglobus sp.]